MSAGKVQRCEYCRERRLDLRPYGKGGTWICIECGAKTENIATTYKRIEEVCKEIVDELWDDPAYAKKRRVNDKKGMQDMFDAKLRECYRMN